VSVRRTAVLCSLVLALALVAGACADAHKYDPLPVPDASEDTSPTSSTVAPRLDEIALAPVQGTTSTTTAIGPGPVTIVGRVDGPDGPVSNARVHLERLVGDRFASVDVPTGPDGSWNIQNVLGGRYRIRAYQTPSLGMLRAQVVFVDSPQAKPVVLRIDRFDGTKVESALAPSPPLVGADANLKVRVVVRQVDAQGIVRTIPQAGISVTLTGTGSWSVATSNPAFTDASGEASFEVQCGATGTQPLSATLGTGESQPLDLPACA
jgi:hypothetical protein